MRNRSAQCNPAVMGIAVLLLCVIMGGNYELHKHWTGFMQAVTIALAVSLLGAAVLLIRGAMLLVNRAPLPVKAPVPELVSGGVTREEIARTADEAPVIPDDAPDMAAEADRLARADLGIVVSEQGTIYELVEPSS